MKQVSISVVNGRPFVSWCDVDTIAGIDVDTIDKAEIHNFVDDTGNWLIEHGNWNKYEPSRDEDIGKSIIRLHDATVSMQNSKNVAPDSEGRLHTIRLVSIKACYSQPEGFEDDWINIIRFVQEVTSDEDLRSFIDASNVTIGAAIVLAEQNVATAKRLEKSAETKKLRKPAAKHKLTGYEHAKMGFGGKPEHGNTDALIRFWKLVVTKTDEARLNDEDPVYDDIDPVSWGVTWKTARNQIQKLLKQK